MDRTQPVHLLLQHLRQLLALPPHEGELPGRINPDQVGLCPVDARLDDAQRARGHRAQHNLRVQIHPVLHRLWEGLGMSLAYRPVEVDCEGPSSREVAICSRHFCLQFFARNVDAYMYLICSGTNHVLRKRRLLLLFQILALLWKPSVLVEGDRIVGERHLESLAGS